jgi:4-hydroxy-tetrahydrodipicolinate synthase
MAFPKFEGIMTVLTTPFKDNGEIHFDALGEHIEYLLKTGIRCLIEGGTTGEYYSLTLEERKRLLTFVAERAKGRAQLVAGSNSVRPAETLELNAYAEDLGYEAAMVASPFYALPTTGELVAHFRRVAAATRLPIILYNFPARTGVDMTPAFLEGIKDVPNIIAIKESSGSFARSIEHFLHFPNLQRICGADDQAVDAFLWGARSWIAGASNILPAEHIALYKAAVVKQDFVLGQRIMATLMPVFFLLEQGGKYIQFVKYGGELAGLKLGPPRPPVQTLSEAEKAQFRALYEKVKAADLPRLVD